MIVEKHIKKIVKLKRKKHHPLLTKTHVKHGISYKTLFYMKEFSPKSHIATYILKESITILILSAIISSIGGIALQTIKSNFTVIIPLLILLPALNGMIGNHGIVIVSKFTALKYSGHIKEEWWKSPHARGLIKVIVSVALLSSIYVAGLSSILAVIQGFSLTFVVLFKVLAVTVVTVAYMILLLVLIAFVASSYIYSKGEDPNNLVIPITTSLADVGTMVALTTMIRIFF